MGKIPWGALASYSSILHDDRIPTFLLWLGCDRVSPVPEFGVSSTLLARSLAYQATKCGALVVERQLATSIVAAFISNRDEEEVPVGAGASDVTRKPCITAASTKRQDSMMVPSSRGREPSLRLQRETRSRYIGILLVPIVVSY